MPLDKCDRGEDLLTRSSSPNPNGHQLKIAFCSGGTAYNTGDSITELLISPLRELEIAKILACPCRL